MSLFPTPTDVAVLTKHDNALRRLVAGAVLTLPEPILVQQFVAEHPGPLPYLRGWEWEVVPGRAQHGTGDLLYADGAGRYAVVEAKFLVQRSGRTAQVQRNQGRRDVRLQARKYAWEVVRLATDATEVLAYRLTNVGGLEAMLAFRRAPEGSTEPWVEVSLPTV